MTLTPGLRKFVRTAHITLAVGWLGAVMSFLALAVAGLTSEDMQLVRAAYLAMDLVARFVIVPLSFAPLITGPVLALGTPWGLFRHYWILVKLVITILAAFALQVHLRPIHYIAGAAAETLLSSADLRDLRVQLVIYAGAALVALLVIATLSVYKPRGVTPYGWRKLRERQPLAQPSLQ